MEKKNFRIVPEEEVFSIDFDQIKNINIGIMGHIDSGKTSITKILTIIASTASLDKNPQSQERGITIDIGFSSFLIEFLEQKLIEENKTKYLQITIVDCPGHASFIKSVIAGASIIDLMILVMDIQKGVQIQTAECLALGEIMNLNLVIVFNKIDLIEKNVEETKEKKKKAILTLLQKTTYQNKEKIPVIFFSCKNENKNQIFELISAITEKVENIERKIGEKNLMISDHCFDIKGKGTVLTGTIISGSFSTGDEIELPEHGEKRIIKSIQSFKRKKEKAQQGDRVAFLVQTLKSEEIQRCYVTKNTKLCQTQAFLAIVDFCKYFKFPVSSKSKYHISIGHLNIKAFFYLFMINKKNIENQEKKMENFRTLDEKKSPLDLIQEYSYIKEINNEKISLFDRDISKEELEKEGNLVMGVFIFDKPQFLLEKNFYLGSKFDFQSDQKFCRIAFSGISLQNFQDKNEILNNLKLCSDKQREGEIEKHYDDYTIIIINMFKKTTDISKFLGKKVFLKDDQQIEGEIFAKFGGSGKKKFQKQKEKKQF